MSRESSASSLIVRGCKTAALALAALLPLTLSSTARADETFNRIGSIFIPSASKVSSFDIGFVDQRAGIYILALRDANGIPVINARTDQYLYTISGYHGSGKPNGPNGVLVAGDDVVGGDGPSTVLINDLRTGALEASIDTGGIGRADELGYDPRDHLVMIANPDETASTGPWLSIISLRTNQIVQKIYPGYAASNAPGSPNADNDGGGGIEQTIWMRQTGMFYTAIPEINGRGYGEILITNPRTLSIVGAYPTPNCEPAGLVQGPGTQALLGCSVKSASEPVQIWDLRSGHEITTVPGVYGPDQVGYGDGHYFPMMGHLTLPNGAVGATGVIDALSGKLDQLIQQGTGTKGGVHAGVGLYDRTDQLFFPIKAGTDPTGVCNPTGCIGVFAISGRDDHHEHFDGFGH